MVKLGRAFALVAMLLSGCGGGSATRPSPASDLPFRPGHHTLSMFADFLECNSDRTLAEIGGAVTVQTNLITEGGAWVARPVGAEGGSVEIQFHRGTASTLFGLVPVAGTIQGVAIDSFDHSLVIPGAPPPTGVQASFPAVAAIEGTMALTGFASSGEVFSAVVFRKGDRAVTCPSGSVHWSFNSSGL